MSTIMRSPKSAILFVAAMLGCLLPSTSVFAGGSASGSSAETGIVVLLILIVGAAYLLAHFVVGRLQRRFLVMSGVEYMILGMLLGPAVPEIRVLDDMTGLLPIIALTAGWIGLLRGTDYELAGVRRLQEGTSRIVLLHSIVPGVLVFLGVYALYSWGVLGDIQSRTALACASVLGCCAAADSAEPIDLLRGRYAIQGKLADLLRGSTRVGDVLVILAFGIFVAIFHAKNSAAGLRATPTEWVVITFALGIGLGVLFTIFLGGDDSENGRFLALVGVITFASGAAYFLALSPIIVSLVLGVVLINVSPRTGRSVHRTLESTERPIGIVLWVMSGVLWRMPQASDLAQKLMPWGENYWVAHPDIASASVVAIATLAYIVLRLISKSMASRMAAFGTDLRSDLFRGLLAHGDVTVAMLVSFRLVFDGVFVDIVYSVGLVSVVAHDLVAPRILRSLLVDSGAIDREQSFDPQGAV